MKISNQIILAFLGYKYYMVKQRMASMMMSVSYKFNKKSSSPQDLVIDYVQKAREMRDRAVEYFSRLDKQGTRTERPHPVR